MHKFSNPGAMVFGLSLILSNCGGGDSTPAGPTTPPATTPAAAPAPKPTPAPTPDPRLGLAPGPVSRFTIKVRTVDAGAREVVQDSQGRWLVNIGERLDFDSTQKNAGGDICQWVVDPAWLVDGQNMSFESSNGVVFRRGSSQPFLLKLTIEKAGTFSVMAEIDGVRSNVLDVRAR